MTTLRVPGDKSIAHRCLLLAALGNGTSHLRGVPEGLDVRATRRALESLGVAFENTADALGVRGCGGDFVSPAGPIDCGNSGTTMRLLAGVLATRAVNARLEGDASLCARPMRRITEPLGAFGAAIGTTRDGTAPLDLTGNSAARGTDLTVAIPSAQVKSALMLAALGAKGRTTLRGALDTRDHTERLFEAFGVRAQRDANTLVVEGPATPRAIDFDVPGDISSAAFLLAAAAASPDAHLCIEDVGLNPTRTAFLDVLRRFGASVETTLGQSGTEPRGRIEIRGATLRAIEIAPHEVAELIDELPLVGVLGMFARGTTVVSGASELRYKESDRIERFAAAARALGADVRTAPDGFAVRGPAALRDADVVTGGDHRIAMAFSVAARIGRIEVALDDEACAAISFPGFAEALAAV